MESTCESCTRRFFVPGSGTSEVACPSCGGNMVPERDQPGGVNSDGDLRNMSGPGYGQDMGGDPLTEGILSPSIAGERSQPMNKRDESYASVRVAAQSGQETPSLPGGIHNGTMKSLQFCGATINGMQPGGELYQWTLRTWLPAAREGQPQPVTVEVQSDHPAYLKAALGIVRVSSKCQGDRMPPAPEFQELYAGINDGSIPAPTWLKGYSRTTSFHWAASAQATPSLPAGVHMGCMGALQFVGATVNGIPPGPELYQWTIKEWLPAAREGQPQPVTVEVQNEHPAYLAAAVGIINNSSACAGKRIPVQEFKALIEGIQGGSIPPPPKQARTAAGDDFDLGGWGFEDDDGSGPTSTHKFIVDKQGQIYSQEEPTHHEQVAEAAGLDMSNFPVGLSLGHLNSDGSTEWYQHQSGQQPSAMAQGLEQHFGTPVTIDPSLKPSSSEERFGIDGPGARGKGRSELQINQDPPMPRSYGVPMDRSEGLVRGGHLDQTIHIPYEHLAMEKEAILWLAPAAAIAGRALLPKLAPKLLGGAMKPGAGAAKGLGGKVLKTLGLQTAVKGVGNALTGGGTGQVAPPPVVAPDLSQVSHITADAETVTSLPGLHENDGDTSQFKDGEATTNPDHPNDDEGGGSMSPAGALLDHLMPKVLEWYDSEESGENDPLMKALDEAIERELPNYKDGDSDDHSDLERFFDDLANEHHKKAADAVGQFFPGMGIQPGAQPLMPGNAAVPPRAVGAPVGPQPTEGICPSCGALLNPDGSCAQCGFGTNNQSQPAQINQAVTPGTSVGGPSLPTVVQSRVADTQGPYTPEQYKAVAEYLLQSGREAEIPHMYDAPWEYADVLAEIQNKLNEPPPAVAAPAEAPAPPMDPAMGMDPSMPPDPSQMQASIQSAVARFAADNITPKCPKCESHTTGMMGGGDEGISCRCHNCGNVWQDKDIAPKTAEVAQHPHDHPILEHSDLSDETDSPHPEENDMTWKTPDGEALTEGQEYEMHSDEYSIPDVIRVEQVKPNELVYTITGEYSELEDQTTISPEEVDQRGIKFLPVEGEAATEESFDSTEPTPAARVPITTSVAPEVVAPQPTKVEPPKEAAWLLEGTNVTASVPAPWETPLPDLTGGPQETAPEGDRDWLVADLPRTAGARFSPGEQRTFIDEEGEARNLDRLDLEDTHYRTKETSVNVPGRGHRSAQPDIIREEDFALGF